MFTLLVVGMASTVPDDAATTTGPRAAAPVPTRCDVIPEPMGVSLAQWNELRVAPHPSDIPSAETMAAVATTLHGFVACVNARPDLQTLLGHGTEHTALVWIGDPWLLPDERVAVPIITRRGMRAEAWRLVVVERWDDRYRVDAVMTIDPRSGMAMERMPRPAS